MRTNFFCLCARDRHEHDDREARADDAMNACMRPLPSSTIVRCRERREDSPAVRSPAACPKNPPACLHDHLPATGERHVCQHLELPVFVHASKPTDEWESHGMPEMQPLSKTISNPITRGKHWPKRSLGMMSCAGLWMNVSIEASYPRNEAKGDAENGNVLLEQITFRLQRFV